MGSLKEIRNRIKTVKNTRKITSAMSRIAAARLVKAQQTATAARPYGERLDEIVRDLMGEVDASEGAELSPLMATPRVLGDVPRVGLLVITADRGLCGGFNANVNRAARNFILDQRGEGREVVTVTVGRKGRSYLAHERMPSVKHHAAPALDTVVERAKAVSHEVSAMFVGGGGDSELPRVHSFYMIYNYFRSALTQEVTTTQLLPFTAAEAESSQKAEPDVGAGVSLLEPDPGSLLAHLLPVALESRIQQAMFNSVAAEIAARRMAMNSATDNASELIDELTLIYNRERQAAITKELMEIIGGAEAIKG